MPKSVSVARPSTDSFSASEVSTVASSTAGAAWARATTAGAS